MRLFFSIIVLALLLSNCNKQDDINPDNNPDLEAPDSTGPVAVKKTNPMKIYVHYMPWFETPSTNGVNWGQHWTMANKNPENINGDGQREIASYFYPTIGPYASSDKDVIEYHLLLMKYAGIDGLIIDWYGSSDVYDFGNNRTNTEAVIDLLDNVGLTFAVTYEDWTLNAVVNQTDAETVLDAAIADFDYLEKEYFNLDNYINIDGEPLLTVFGPQVITTEADWTILSESLSKSSANLSLWYESGEMGSNAFGEFSWVYEDNSHIENFYKNQKSKFNLILGSAYPGFKDFYTEGGKEESALPWEIDHNNGVTFDETLAMAQAANIDYLQLITWNDFGEGTNIEPTREYGYQYLEKLQVFSGTPYSGEEFEYISKLYNLRKSQADNSSAQTALDKSFDYFVKLQVEDAKAVIDSLEVLY